MMLIPRRKRRSPIFQEENNHDDRLRLEPPASELATQTQINNNRIQLTRPTPPYNAIKLNNPLQQSNSYTIDEQQTNKMTTNSKPKALSQRLLHPNPSSHLNNTKMQVIDSSLLIKNKLIKRPRGRQPISTTSLLLVTLTLVTTISLLVDQQPLASAFLFQSTSGEDSAPNSNSNPNSRSQTSIISSLIDSKPSSNSDQNSGSGSLISSLLESAAKSAISAASGHASSSHPHHSDASNSKDKPDNKLTAKSSSGSPSTSGSSGSSSTASIAASLSSAVASAAAAAAVAAAQSSLSGGGSHSKSSSTSGLHRRGVSPNTNSQTHKSSSSLNHIAMRLADAIPEVPYSILHNMKKLDHAAPFYNVDSSSNLPLNSGNKLLSSSSSAGGLDKASAAVTSASSSGSIKKEASLSPALSLLTSVLQAASTNDQLTALFRLPLWRRLADGYGDFAAEFRSFFKPISSSPSLSASIGSSSSASPGSPLAPSSPNNQPTKASGLLASGSSASSLMSGTKLLRDISLPALLMLVASAMPSEWRPTKARRKSLMQSIIGGGASSSSDSSASSGAVDPLQMSGSQPLGQAAANPLHQFSNQLLNAAFQQQQQQQQQQAAAASGFSFAAPQLLANSLFNQHHNQVQQQQQPDLASALAAPGQQAVTSAALKRMGDTDGPLAMYQQQQAVDVKPVHLFQAIPPSSEASNFESPQQSGPMNSFLLETRNSMNNEQQSDNQDKQQARSINDYLATGNWITSQNQNEQPQPTAQLLAMERSLNGNVDRDHASQTTSLHNIIPSIANKLFSKRASLVNQQHDGIMATKRRHDETTNVIRVNTNNAKHRYSLVDSEPASDAGLPNGEKPKQQAKLLSVVSNFFSSSSHNQPTTSIQAKADKRESGGLPLAPTSTSDKKTTTSNEQSTGEQRDLSQLVPQSWKEAVKRTYSSVQQTASTQWRSFEGQVSSWVQDKLKPNSASGPSQASGASSSPTGSASSAGSNVASFISNVGSAAVNMLGFGPTNGINNNANNKSAAGSSGTNESQPTRSTTNGQSSSGSDSTGAQSASHSNGSGSSTSSSNQQQNKQPVKTALVNLGSMIFNSITGSRSSSSPSTSNSNSGSTSGSGSSSSSSSTTSKPVLS